MFISHKSNVIQHTHEAEWGCRKLSKGMSKDEYWAWIKTITDSDGVVTFPSEDFTIVECTDENVRERLTQLNDYINHTRREPGTALVYNIKWQDDIGNAEEILDRDGKNVLDEDGEKTYVQSHFVGDDTAKDARLLAEEWTRIRRERDRLLTSSDWTQANDTALASAKVTAWATYRTKLRTLPEDQKAKTTYTDITWPTQPS